MSAKPWRKLTAVKMRLRVKKRQRRKRGTSHMAERRLHEIRAKKNEERSMARNLSNAF